ncbi:MAG: hypothetical protein KC449_28315, partial [Anaerolineales bacterium]|nr:hypothetical protein [Anaerolineales bacterium]
MTNQQLPDNLSVQELEQLLYRKKHALRRQRLQRLKADGRVVEAAGVPPPSPLPPIIPRPQAVPGGALRQYQLQLDDEPEAEPDDHFAAETRPNGNGRSWLNRLLFLVEVGAVVGLVAVLLNLWGTQRELNQELSQVQHSQAAGLALPTPTTAPLIDLVVLPTGHRYVD